jgi:hypothetical protein
MGQYLGRCGPKVGISLLRSQSGNKKPVHTSRRPKNMDFYDATVDPTGILLINPGLCP